MTNEEEAITIIKKEFSKYADTLSVYAKKRKKALDMAIQALEQQRNITNEELYQGFIELEAENERLHDALEQQRWIPVSEGLPEEMGTYMTTIDYGKCGLATGQRYYFGQGVWEDDCVIAWQPLPQPYKEG